VGIGIGALIVMGIGVLGAFFCVRRGVCHGIPGFQKISWLKIDPTLKAELVSDNPERLA
jgi:hypothetical protein